MSTPSRATRTIAIFLPHEIMGCCSAKLFSEDEVFVPAEEPKSVSVQVGDTAYLVYQPARRSLHLHLHDDWHQDAEFKRKGNRYTLTFRLEDAPFGGICAWKFEGILVSAKRAPRSGEMTVLRLSNLDDVPVHLKEQQKRVKPGTMVRCGRETQGPDIECDF